MSEAARLVEAIECGGGEEGEKGESSRGRGKGHGADFFLWSCPSTQSEKALCR